MNREPRTHFTRFVLCHKGLNDTSRRKLYFFHGACDRALGLTSFTSVLKPILVQTVPHRLRSAVDRHYTNCRFPKLGCTLAGKYFNQRFS